MLTRLRAVLASWLIRTPVRVALGLYAGYLLFAWLGFEPLVKWAAPKFIAGQSQHRLSIDSARFNPFTLALDFKDLPQQ